MNKKKINTIVGSIGAFIGVFVFITYIPQIIANLGGEKAQPWQPLTASISCLIWVIYGWTKEPKKDFILIVPNLAGVILGFLTFIIGLSINFLISFKYCSLFIILSPPILIYTRNYILN